MHLRRIRAAFAAALAIPVVLAGAARADTPPTGWHAKGLELVGFSALGGRPGAFKLAIKHAANGHWYLYAGHSFDLGWSIVDVTDPKAPRYVRFIPYQSQAHQGTDEGGILTAQVTLHGDVMITSIDRRSTTDPTLLVWDIRDPENPRRVGEWKGAEGGSHRNTYPGGKYAYVSANTEGYRGHVMVILDVSDPAHPVQAGIWAQPGQKNDEPAKAMAPGMHGPVGVSPDGKMATVGYTPDIINLDMTDPVHPKLIGRLTMVPPFGYAGLQSVHTALPIWDRKLIYANNEASAWGCDKTPMNWAAMIDNKDPAHPRLMSFLPTPREVPPGAPYKTFCERQGRFGPHNTVMEQHNPDVHPIGRTLYVTWFDAGLRAFDIADPYFPTETGWFVPPDNPKDAANTGRHAAPTNWMEDVTQDTRGYIYVGDDQYGLWILRDPKGG